MILQITRTADMTNSAISKNEDTEPEIQDILANHYYLTTFLPLSHPQYYLPMMFRLWEAVNSYAYDERMLAFLAKLTEMHVDPNISSPKRIEEIPEDWGESPRVRWPRQDSNEDWRGLFKDVGIFNDDQWSHIMCKCLASMGAVVSVITLRWN